MFWTLLYGAILKRKFEKKGHDVECLKQAIIKEWRNYSQEIINNATDSFRERLR